MSIVRHWLSRAAPVRPALILPDGATLTFGALARRTGRPELNVLHGDAGTLALGLVDCALDGGSALLLPPGLENTARDALIHNAQAASSRGIALVITTSGSTGAPKGVRLPWRAVAAGARITARALELQPGDVCLVCLPLYFVGGAMIFYRCLRAGATAVVHEGFDIKAVAYALEEQGITHLSLEPAMLARLLDAAVPPGPSLRCALIGGQALAPALAAEARAARRRLSASCGARLPGHFG
jgi:acyl-CoA synthetase (AMP-forming)/AMP-acid ligase II